MLIHKKENFSIYSSAVFVAPALLAILSQNWIAIILLFLIVSSATSFYSNREDSFHDTYDKIMAFALIIYDYHLLSLAQNTSVVALLTLLAFLAYFLTHTEPHNQYKTALWHIAAAFVTFVALM